MTGNDIYTYYIRLYVPFEMKDKVKHSGCRWNKERKSWMANPELIDKFPFLDQYTEKPKKLYYEVPFDIKDEFKRLGGKFDFKIKKWYIWSNKWTIKFRDFVESDYYETDSDSEDENLIQPYCPVTGECLLKMKK